MDVWRGDASNYIYSSLNAAETFSVSVIGIKRDLRGMFSSNNNDSAGKHTRSQVYNVILTYSPTPRPQLVNPIVLTR